MTEQEITPYVNWTKSMLRYHERSVVVQVPGIQEWSLCFSATAARIDRFLQLGHEGCLTLPQSLVLDIVELDQGAPSDALASDGLLKNFVLFWSALADVYGSSGTRSQTEAKRLELLMEWSLLLTALPGTNYPGVKLLAPRYRHERARLALTKLRKGTTDYAHVALGLQLVQEHEASLGMRWDMRSASFSRIDEAAGRGLKSSLQPWNRCRGKLNTHDQEFLVGASSVRAVKKPTLTLELHGNWRDHWSNTLP